MCPLPTRLLLCLPILLALVAAAPALHAAPSSLEEQSAKDAFRRGNEAYEKKKFADALEHYRKSYDAVPRPNVLFNIARTKEQLGDYEGAFLDYTRFLQVAEASNKRLLDARAKIDELAQKALVTVSVTSDPPGAAITADDEGRPAGYTPGEIKLKPGPHALHATREHFEPRDQTITVGLGARPKVHFVLPALVPVEVFTDPPTAEILLQGDARGPVIGHFQRELRAGLHVFTIRAPGIAEQRLEVLAKPGDAVRKRIPLAVSRTTDRGPLTGMLVVASPTPGATVYVDAMPAGSTPKVERPLPPGEHTVSVEKTGLPTWQGKVIVVGGKTVSVEVKLGSGGGLRPATWALGISSVASLAAFAVFGYRALGFADDRDKAKAMMDDVRAKTLDDSRGTSAILADVFLGVSGATLLGAFLVQRGSSSESTATVEPAR